MKTPILAILSIIFFHTETTAQENTLQIKGKEVFRNEDVVFHQIDEHTWVGTGHLYYNESLYLLEGTDKAVLIDAGAEIMNLDKIVASITSKPVMLVATHVHPDHTGQTIKYFPEIYINPGDTKAMARWVPDYTGKINFLRDRETIDLGGRQLEVVFTPAHTPGSTTFIDKDARYGFSGDSFGSGTLLLELSFSTLIETCQKIKDIMEKQGITFLYPGHFNGTNQETKQRIEDLITLSKEVLSGKIKGKPNQWNELTVSKYNVNISYSEESLNE
jgi:hydroxyacylglutathione hydrolase